jgi:hypothetical protein
MQRFSNPVTSPCRARSMARARRIIVQRLARPRPRRLKEEGREKPPSPPSRLSLAAEKWNAGRRQLAVVVDIQDGRVADHQLSSGRRGGDMVRQLAGEPAKQAIRVRGGDSNCQHLDGVAQVVELGRDQLFGQDQAGVSRRGGIQHRQQFSLGIARYSQRESRRDDGRGPDGRMRLPEALRQGAERVGLCPLRHKRCAKADSCSQCEMSMHLTFPALMIPRRKPVFKQDVEGTSF